MRKRVPVWFMILLAAGCSSGEKKGGRPAEKVSWPEGPIGKELFDERCRECHKVLRREGIPGADLSAVGSKRGRAYLEQAIREPSKLFPGTPMPTYDTFSVRQVNSLVDYLSTLK